MEEDELDYANAYDKVGKIHGGGDKLLRYQFIRWQLIEARRLNDLDAIYNLVRTSLFDEVVEELDNGEELKGWYEKMDKLEEAYDKYKKYLENFSEDSEVGGWNPPKEFPLLLEKTLHQLILHMKGKGYAMPRKMKMGAAIDWMDGSR